MKIKLVVILAKIFQYLRLSSRSTDENGTIYGEEFKALEEIFNNLGTKLTVIDVGSNDGSWSLKLLKLYGHQIKDIHMIEPNPFLPNQDFRTHYTSIERYFFAISLKTTLNIYFNESSGSTYAHTNSQKKYKLIEVNGITGDRFVENFKLKPNFIKVDTDGMDFEVLKTFTNTIQSSKPIIQFEFCKRFAKKAKYSLKDNIFFLEQLGYLVYVIDSLGMLRTIKFPQIEVIGQQTKNFLALPISYFSRFNSPLHSGKF